jgi:hypothetical protein
MRTVPGQASKAVWTCSGNVLMGYTVRMATSAAVVANNDPTMYPRAGPPLEKFWFV